MFEFDADKKDFDRVKVLFKKFGKASEGYTVHEMLSACCIAVAIALYRMTADERATAMAQMVEYIIIQLGALDRGKEGDDET